MSRKILAVDDDPVNLLILEEMLFGSGHAVEYVADGESAWRALTSSTPPFDVIVLDHRMPGISGAEILRRIRADASLCRLVVIMQSAEASKFSIDEALAHGADAYLTKPFETAELLNTIARLTNRRD